ncbi:hypothetical protein ROLI_048610 (plasmid) [Roseobacter fucihabitans]|uniref:Uncharacterized protein n=1 Tax=Roseobacter fucihabitans TaxID=1537242 RepID=A0ABZ2C4C6_9RHOB|nr:hypothetical protein [Roseobacter litoralis]
MVGFSDGGSRADKLCVIYVLIYVLRESLDL